MSDISLNKKIEILHAYGINLDTKTIYIAGEIDANSNLSLRMKIDTIKQYWDLKDQKVFEVNLFLSSPGGDATAIPAMIDAYENYLKEGIKINIVTEGVCYSAATFFVACATGHRAISKNTRFLVHELQISGVGGTHTQTKSFSKELELLNDEMIKIYANCTIKAKLKREEKITEAENKKIISAWQKRIQNETYLSAEEALKLGLVDEVL